MRFSALLGWGITIYAIVGLAAGILSVYGVMAEYPLLGTSFMLVALISVCTAAARSLRHYTWSDILPYSFGWTLICMGLDALLVVPVAGSSIYADPNVWVGYALVLMVPLFAPFTRPHRTAAHVS